MSAATHNQSQRDSKRGEADSRPRSESQDAESPDQLVVGLATTDSSSLELPFLGVCTTPESQELEATAEFLRPLFSALSDVQSAPDRVDRYIIKQILGRGGYGVVFLADDTELGRQVALKVPRPERFSKGANVESFLQEARLAATLRHPNIVTIHDVVRTSETLLIVMQYVKGRNLAHVLRSGRIETRRAVELTILLSDAIGHAHQNHLIHRDLKPSNILLDEGGTPYVTDFGLAVRAESQYREKGRVAGTPSYMAPEQVRGESHHVDGRTDIWSLGVIFYEMLCGRVPFQAVDREALFDEILNREPKPPRQINPKIPDELERICLRCIAKQVQDRYATADDLAADLGNWLESDEGGTQGETTIKERSPSKRRGWNSFLSAAALLTAIVAAAFAWKGLQGPRDIVQDSPVASGSSPISGTSSRPARDFESLPDSALQPLIPYSLFNRQPDALLWPNDGGLSIFQLDPKVRQLSLNCREDGVLAMGTIARDSWTLRLDIHQVHWEGGVGVFWGYSGQPGIERQSDWGRILRLEHDPKRGKHFLVKGRFLIRKRANGISDLVVVSQTEAEIPILRAMPQQLEITIRNQRLTRVRWSGNELPGLVDAVSSDPEVVSTGHFGIAATRCAAILRNADLVVFENARP